MTTQNNRESMRYPSVDQLTEMTTSKYKLVIAAANRAKEIDRWKNSFAYKKQRLALIDNL